MARRVASRAIVLLVVMQLPRAQPFSGIAPVMRLQTRACADTKRAPASHCSLLRGERRQRARVGVRDDVLRGENTLDVAPVAKHFRNGGKGPARHSSSMSHGDGAGQASVASPAERLLEVAAASLFAAGAVLGGPDSAPAFYEPSPAAAAAAAQHRGIEGCAPVWAASPGSRPAHAQPGGVVLHKAHRPSPARGRHCPFSPPATNEGVVAQAAASIDEYEVVRLDALGPYPSETDLPFLSKKSTEEISMPVNMVLAFVASAFATALLHPVDTVKARLQASSTASETGEGSSDQSGPARRLVKWQSLYTGVFANLAREGPSNALYLAVFEQAKVTIFANPATRHFAHTAPVAALLLAGAIGDAAGCILSMPAEIVKRRLQTGASSGYLQAFLDAVSSEAARINTQSSIAAVLLRDIPEGALQIMLFETWRSMAVEASPLFDNFGASVMIGVAAGAIAALVTTPFDVVVSKLAAVKPGSSWQGPAQAPPCRAGKAGPGTASKVCGAAHREAAVIGAAGCTPLQVMQDIVGRDGWAGLMKGAGHRAAYYGPIAGIFFACFTALQELVVDEGRMAYIVASLSLHQGHHS